MKKTNRVLAIILAVITILAVPFTAQCAVKTLSLSAKGYKKVTNINKTGTYSLKCRFKEGVYSQPEFVSFQAPSSGTYVFKFNNLRDVKDPSSRESFCSCSLTVGSSEAFKGWLDQYDTWYGDSQGPVFKENKDYRIRFGSIWDVDIDDRDVSMATVKYKLKKGEKIYFTAHGPSTNYAWMNEDQTVVMDLTVKKK